MLIPGRGVMIYVLSNVERRWTVDMWRPGETYILMSFWFIFGALGFQCFLLMSPFCLLSSV